MNTRGALFIVCTFLVAIVSFFIAPPTVIRDLLNLFNLDIDKILPKSPSSTPSSTSSSTPSPTTAQSTTFNMARMPTYFFSHGGPDVQYNKTHPVYPVLQQIGREITSLKPTAIVVFSAHWQATPVTVNTALLTDLIYDFYGFPSHFYKATYPNTGSPPLAARIISLLTAAAIPAEGSTRGLDHGVWSGFNVAFDPASNPLNCPLVQVSLHNSEDPETHYALGRAVSALRDEGVVIIGAGMSVHNLRDMRAGMASPHPLPYSVSFDNALKDAVLEDPVDRERKMVAVSKRADAKQAHPWMDHLMPVYVAAGAAEEEKGSQIWTMQEGSFAWAQYRFGEIPEGSGR